MFVDMVAQHALYVKRIGSARDHLGPLVRAALRRSTALNIRETIIQGWQELDVGQKLRFCFALLITVSVILSALVYAQSQRMAEAARQNAASDELVNCLDNMRFATLKTEAAVRDIAFRGDASAIGRIRHYQTLLARLHLQARAVLSRERPHMLADFDAYWSSLQTYDREITGMHLHADGEKLADRLADGSHDKADAARARDVAAHFTVIRRQVEDWSRFTDDEGLLGSSRTSVFVLLSAVVTIGFGVLVTRFIERAVTTPIRDMTAIMQALAAGDMSVEVPAADSSAEIGRMAKAVEVFRLAAVDRNRLQREATATSAAIALERDRNETERAVTASHLTAVVFALEQASERLARGDLSSTIGTPFAEAYETLRSDFNSALIELRAMIERVAITSHAIERSAQELADDSIQLARRAASRASDLRHAASTLNATTFAIEASTINVEEVGTRVNLVRLDAKRSEQIVVEARASMERIGAASNQIARITALIDAIAGKSNLLALNAVIEAARAGVEGRGFAVVASEVRVLARQSAEAASEIRSLVAEANDQIGLGADKVLEAGEVLHRIGEQIFAIDDIAQVVAASSRKQTASLAALNRIFAEIDDATHDDAVFIMRSDAAVQALTGQTRHMAQLVSRFVTTSDIPLV